MGKEHDDPIAYPPQSAISLRGTAKTVGPAGRVRLFHLSLTAIIETGPFSKNGIPIILGNVLRVGVIIGCRKSEPASRCFVSTIVNSVQQTILGLVLVGIAFIFGSYLHRDDGSQIADQQNESQEMQDLSWQGQNTNQRPQSTSSLPTMRKPQLQLANRDPQQLEEANLVPDLDRSANQAQWNQGQGTPNQGETLKELSYKIAQPDFSQYEFETEEVDPPKPMESDETLELTIATPQFETHFPASENNDLRSIQPKKPMRDESVNQHNPATRQIAVTPKRNEFQGQLSPNLDSRSFEVRRPDEMSRSGIATQTAVAPIRPRNDSPIMANTKRFKSHQTVQGETLQGLAMKYFGDPNYYLDIYVANRNVLNNPAELPTGTQLRIPIYE